MATISLKSEKRKVFGRKVKVLRKGGLIPANVYGKKIKSEAVSVDASEFSKVFQKAGETQIIDLSGKPVLVSNVSYDPVEGNVLHIDFRQVDLTEKVTAEIPIEVVGESPAEKQNLGTVVTQIDELEVEALPQDLPEKIIVDSSVLTEVDQAIYVKDLKISNKVKVLEDLEAIVIKVEPPQKEEEVEKPVQVEGELPADGSQPQAEGEESQVPEGEAGKPPEEKTSE